MEKEKEKAVKAIKEFLHDEVDYVTFMEEAVQAQTEIMNLIDESHKTGNAPDIEGIVTFFFHAIPAIKLLRPFEP